MASLGKSDDLTTLRSMVRNDVHTHLPVGETQLSATEKDTHMRTLTPRLLLEEIRYVNLLRYVKKQGA